MRPASDKQRSFAKSIAKALKLSLPTELTAYAYWKFINDHILEFQSVISEDPSLDDYYDYFPSEWAYDGCGCEF